MNIPQGYGAAYSPHVALVIGALNAEDCHSAIRYVNPKYTVKATAPKRQRKNARQRTVIVTYGKPNYNERQFIKDALAAGEPFPIKKVQLRYWPHSVEGKAVKVARKALAGKKLSARETRTLAAASLHAD